MTDRIKELELVIKGLEKRSAMFKKRIEDDAVKSTQFDENLLFNLGKFQAIEFALVKFKEELQQLNFKVIRADPEFRNLFEDPY